MYPFNLVITYPTAIHVGMEPSFEIEIAPQQLLQTQGHESVLRPPIELISLSVMVNANVDVRAEDKYKRNSHTMTFTNSVYTWLSVPGTYLARFDNKHGWKAKLKAAASPLEMAPDFDTLNISVRHSIKVEWILRCAGEAFMIRLGPKEREFLSLRVAPIMHGSGHTGAASEVTDAPAPDDASMTSGAMAKMTQGAADSESNEEDPPSYTDIAGRTQVQSRSIEKIK
ncbi:MAG: hypothetical protein Q9162_002814 [Coniocarpon cinnabarinum]